MIATGLAMTDGAGTTTTTISRVRSVSRDLQRISRSFASRKISFRSFPREVTCQTALSYSRRRGRVLSADRIADHGSHPRVRASRAFRGNPAPRSEAEVEL